jgi:D-alanyl-D-alanine carboxypeptidase/D-alanyl-D-alanine-endopeptidase (penicillin-binding protein 4)
MDVMVSRAFLLVVIQLLALISAQAQSTQSLEARIKTIVNRPEFQRALFGIEVYSLTDDKILYALNADKLFVPGSVTKLLTEGAAMSLLGADYRFRTRVYRTGPVSQTGVLAGDLVLVASGDPNLSNRIQHDTLAFENEDHAYGQVLEARLVPGDPLVVIRNLAKQVASKGVKTIEGRVLVDVSLFPEGTREGGSAVVISPMSLNDNVIDVIVKPGSTPGSPASLQSSPVTTYATFQNEVQTGPADSTAEIQFATTSTTDGTLSVKVRGTVPLKSAPRPFPFAVPQPGRFAEVTFAEALRELGVDIKGSSSSGNTDRRALYTEENQMAEHISPPFAEDVKVTLKVSQNLHAAMTPYLLGALLQKEHDDALLAGFKQMRKFLQAANLDVSAAAQSDGAGAGAYFTPDFMVRYLAFMAKQKDFRRFYDSLPILGRDGTLADTGRNLPAAGKLRAKTGTHITGDFLNEQYMVNGKGLAGYLETRDGKQIIFAVFVNHLPVAPEMPAVLKVGDALAEIAAAAYDAR